MSVSDIIFTYGMAAGNFVGELVVVTIVVVLAHITLFLLGDLLFFTHFRLFGVEKTGSCQVGPAFTSKKLTRVSPIRVSIQVGVV